MPQQQHQKNKETNMEMKKILESLQECGGMMPQEPMQQGTPVSMNISLNASGKEHVEDLINMMKNAGLGQAREVGIDMMPMRQDMERLRDIVDTPKGLSAPDMEAQEDYVNEPDEKYGDYSDSIPSGDDLHKQKAMYAKAQDGDNAMAVEDIKAALYAALSEKKVGEGWDDMLKSVKAKSAPQPRGGGGVKAGTRYGGSAQKDKPEQDDDKAQAKKK